MKRVISKIMITCCLLLHCVTGKSQPTATLPDIVPVSPEAAGIAKYVNYPVDHSTGLVKIEIPLYEIRTGDIVLPITLSYHASGLKVNESSGIVGSGWTLNAEPSITRAIQGIPDYGTYMTGNINCYFTNYELESLAKYAGGAPDHFYYKLLNKSGAFYLWKICGSNSSQIVTIPFEPLKIQYQNTDAGKFIITDENGISYNFGSSGYYETTENGNAIQFKASSIQSSSTGSNIYFGYSNEIQENILNTIDGIIIADNYTYQNSNHVPDITFLGYNGPITFPYVTSTIYKMGANEPNRMVYTLDANNHLTEEGYVLDAPYVTGSKTTQIRRRLIESISFGQGSVSFLYNSDRLIQIIISSNNKIVKKISLAQSPFYTYSDKYKLDAVTITDASGNKLDQYWFDYYNKDKVPLKSSKRTDHWGYSNDDPFMVALNNGMRVDASHTMCAIPRHLVKLIKTNGEIVQDFVGEIDREPYEENMKSGILSGIQYMTGAYRSFFYEGNYFNSYGISGMSGGLRIEHIEDFDPVTNQTLVTSYKYGLNECGTGYVNRIPSLDDYVVERPKKYKDGIGEINSVRVRNYSSWSINNLFRDGGPPVMYEYVTEYREAANKMMRTTYRYKAEDAAYPLRPPASPYSYHYNVAWRLGQLLEKTIYESDSQSIVEKYNYDYDIFKYNLNNVKIFYAYYEEEYTYPPARPDLPNNPTDTPPIQLFVDNITSGCIRKTSETIQKDGVTANITYQYSNTAHMFPTKITRSNSNGISTVEDLTYPQDNTDLTGDALTARNKLIDQQRINIPLRQKITQNGQSKTVRMDYAIVNNHVVPDVVKTSVNNGAFENRVRYHKHNDYGNPVYVSYEDGPGIVYLWGYNHHYPIAKIENATFDEVKTCMGNETVIDSIAQKDKPDPSDFYLILGLKSQLPNAMVTIYEYDPLIGITAITNPSGRKVQYDYSQGNRLWRIRDETDVLQIFNYGFFQLP